MRDFGFKCRFLNSGEETVQASSAESYAATELAQFDLIRRALPERAVVIFQASYHNLFRITAFHLFA